MDSALKALFEALFQVNFPAVLVAALAAMVIGAFWYSPLLFAKQWMKLMDMSAKDIQAAQRSAGLSYLLGFITLFITAWVLAFFLLTIPSVGTAIFVSLLAWLGFVAMQGVGGVLWENKKWGFFFLNSAYQIVYFVVMAIILYYWR